MLNFIFFPLISNYFTYSCEGRCSCLYELELLSVSRILLFTVYIFQGSHSLQSINQSINLFRHTQQIYTIYTIYIHIM